MVRPATGPGAVGAVSGDGEPQRLHRRGLGDHRCLRRPHPSAHLPVPAPPAHPRRASRPRRSRPRSGCTRTSPVTTSTSWRPAATSRSSPAAPATRRDRAQGRPAVEALHRRPRRGRQRTAAGAQRRPRVGAARPGPGPPAACRGRGDGRGGRRHATAARSPPGSPATRWPPANARCARRCSPSRPRSPPTGSPRPHAPTARPRLRIISDHCPFGSLAIDHPVLCAVDRGLVRGMLTALYPAGCDLAIATESSKARGDTVCATAI